MRSTEVADEINTALTKGAEVTKGCLWLCFIDRNSPLSRENVEQITSQYDRGSPQTLYYLAQNAGLDVKNMSKDWLLREVYPDYREAADPTAAAMVDIYDQCRLFLGRGFESKRDAAAPFGYEVRERFYMREYMGNATAEVFRKLHEAIVHPLIVRTEKGGMPVRIFAATYPGLRPSISLAA